MTNFQAQNAKIPAVIMTDLGLSQPQKPMTGQDRNIGHSRHESGGENGARKKGERVSWESDRGAMEVRREDAVGQRDTNGGDDRRNVGERGVGVNTE